jgi:hypothetical protein
MYLKCDHAAGDDDADWVAPPEGRNGDIDDGISF